MNGRHLEHFLKVIEHGSVSRAAAKSGITQSGLTKSIHALEERIGAKLFTRLPRGVEPTELGRALSVRARLMLAQMRETEAELKALQEGAIGVLAVGAGPSWLRRCLPQAVAQLYSEVPRARLKVRTGFDSELIVALQQGEIDFVVAASHEAQDIGDITIHPLTTDRQSVVASQRHPLAGRCGLTMDDLDDYGWVLADRGTAQRQRFESLYWAAGRRPPDPIIETTSVAFMLELVSATSLISFATASILDAEKASGVMPLVVPELSWMREAGVMVRAAEPLSPIATALLEKLRAVCADLGVN